MTKNESVLLASLAQWAEDAPKLGLCPLTFEAAHDMVEHLINEKYLLLAQLVAEND